MSAFLCTFTYELGVCVFESFSICLWIVRCHITFNQQNIAVNMQNVQARTLCDTCNYATFHRKSHFRKAYLYFHFRYESNNRSKSFQHRLWLEVSRYHLYGYLTILLIHPYHTCWHLGHLTKQESKVQWHNRAKTVATTSSHFARLCKLKYIRTYMVYCNQKSR